MLAVLLVSTGSLQAQEVKPRGPLGDRLREAEERIEFLLPRVEEARDAVARADSARLDSLRKADQIPQDTVEIGPFRIVAPRGQAASAQDILAPALRQILPRIAGYESRFQGHAFVFQDGWRRRPLFVEAPHVHKVQPSPGYSRARIRQVVWTAVGNALFAALPSEDEVLREWAPRSNLGLHRDWGWVYRDLVSTPARAARLCYEGELSWCWEAMGLTAEEGGELSWYTPAERRRLVAAMYGRWLEAPHDRLGLRHILVHGCLEMERDRACQLILEGYPDRNRSRLGRTQIPLGGEARGSLVSEALRIGGEGSFTRLAAQPQLPLKERLGSAAGMPPDSLMARWRERVLASRPDTQAGLHLSPLALSLWLILLLALATRSTRWRLG